MLVLDVFQLFGNTLGIVFFDPAHLQRKTVAVFVNPAGCVGRQFQNGRTAHAPVRKEQGALAFEFGARNPGRGFLYNDTHKLMGCFVFDVKRIKRRYGSLGFVSQSLQIKQVFGERCSTRSDGHTVHAAGSYVGRGKGQSEGAVLEMLYPAHFMACPDFRSILLCFSFQAKDDGLRVL